MPKMGKEEKAKIAKMVGKIMTSSAFRASVAKDPRSALGRSAAILSASELSKLGNLAKKIDLMKAGDINNLHVEVASTIGYA